MVPVGISYSLLENNVANAPALSRTSTTAAHIACQTGRPIYLTTGARGCQKITEPPSPPPRGRPPRRRVSAVSPSPPAPSSHPIPPLPPPRFPAPVKPPEEE